MRNSLLPIITIVAMLFLGACNSDDIVPAAMPDGSRTFTFTATMPAEPTTRVALEENTDKSIDLSWEADDEIKLAFVQGETVENNIATVSTISTDKKSAQFDIVIPAKINTDEPYKIYGVYGGGELTGSNVTLPINPGAASSLADLDLMLYFEHQVTTPGNVAVTFNHLGSIFSITLNNTSSASLDNLTEARLVGDSREDKWAFNNDKGGQVYDLVAGEFKNTNTAGNYISFAAPANSVAAGESITFWGWYPPLPNKNWPELMLELRDASKVLETTVHNMPVRTSPTAAGRSYSFFALWNGSTLEFSNEAFVTPIREKTITLTAKGTLDSKLSAAEKLSITKLTIVGPMNKADFDVIKLGMHNVSFLDLANVTTDGKEVPNEGLNAHEGLSKVVLPTESVSIGKDAFKDCVNLTEVVFNDGLQKTRTGVFQNTGLKGVVKLPSSMIEINARTFSGCAGITGLELNEGLKRISTDVFKNCTSLTGIVEFPLSLSSLYDGAFIGSCNVTAYKFPHETPIYLGATDGGVYKGLVFSEELDKVKIYVPAGKKAAYKTAPGWDLHTNLNIVELGVATELTLNVETMGGLNALLYEHSKSSIEKLTLTGVINDDDIAVINSLPSLTYLDMGDIATLSSIEGDNVISEHSFLKHPTLETVILPKSLTTVGREAFQLSSKLTTLVMNEGLKITSPRAFNNVPLTGTLTFPTTMEEIGYQSFGNCDKVTELVFKEGLYRIHSNSFINCTGITGTVVFPSTLTIINASAFDGCTNITAFRFKSTTPLTYEAGMLPTGATIEVPTGSKGDYDTAWSDGGYDIVEY